MAKAASDADASSATGSEEVAPNTAAPSNAALLSQIKEIASQGQDAETKKQVSQYVDQNQGPITALLNSYANYFKHFQTANDDDGNAAPAPTQSAPASTQTAPPPAQTAPPPAQTVQQPSQTSGSAASSQNTATADAAESTQEGNGVQPSGELQSASIQPSGGLHIAGVQPSGGLVTAHLAGYPSLPAVDPTSSVPHPNAAQLAYAAIVQKEMQDRKAYLMAHPEGYTY